MATGTASSTPAGSLDLAIPKLRYGSYFPDWLLERRKRAEQALTTVVATRYLLGVSLSLRVAYEREETLGIRYALPAEGTRVARCSEICIRLASRQPRIRTHKLCN